MEILFITTREYEYPRNQMLLRIFRSLGNVEVIGSSRRGSLTWRSLGYTLRALTILPQKKFDLIFVGFYGQLVMLPLGFLSRIPIIFDAYLSTYDTLCFDRKVFSPQSLPGRLFYQIDRLSCTLAGEVVLDTCSQKTYFTTTFGVSSNKIRPFFVGCDERLFFPRPDTPVEPFILFYGSYLPLHGVDTIVRAAHLLRDELPLRFRLIGDGPTVNQTRRLAEDLRATNIDFVPSVPLNELPDQIARATICLGGHFGATEKAGRVISSKTYQCLAMAKTVIVGDNPANHELLVHGKDVWFCAMNDPQALADAIRTLYKDPSLRAGISSSAYKTFLEKASFPVLKDEMEKIVREVLG